MTLRMEKAVVSLGLALLLHPTFQGVAAVASTRSIPPPAWLLTPLDGLPVVPAAAWIYLSWYPATAAVLLAGRENFRRAYIAYVLAFAASLPSYLLFPVTITRLPVEPTGLSAMMLQVVYSTDRPINLFPSFHAAVASILWRLRPGLAPMSTVVSLWTVALCTACVVTKQHYVLDVVAGLLVGFVAVALVDAVRSWSRDSVAADHASARRRAGRDRHDLEWARTARGA